VLRYSKRTARLTYEGRGRRTKRLLCCDRRAALNRSCRGPPRLCLKRPPQSQGSGVETRTRICRRTPNLFTDRSECSALAGRNPDLPAQRPPFRQFALSWIGAVTRMLRRSQMGGRGPPSLMVEPGAVAIEEGRDKKPFAIAKAPAMKKTLAARAIFLVHLGRGRLCLRRWWTTKLHAETGSRRAPPLATNPTITGRSSRPPTRKRRRLP